MNPARRRLFAAAGALVFASRGMSQAEPALRVDGSVETALALSLDDLMALPAQQFDDARLAERRVDKPQVRRYRGVLVREVLARAKPVDRQPRGLRRSVVIAAARDGYKAVFSWAELFLSPIGDGALIVYERDGAPLPAGEGPIALVSLMDTSPGPRHVKWLQSIEVRMLDI